MGEKGIWLCVAEILVLKNNMTIGQELTDTSSSCRGAPELLF